MRLIKITVSQCHTSSALEVHSHVTTPLFIHLTLTFLNTYFSLGVVNYPCSVSFWMSKAEALKACVTVEVSFVTHQTFSQAVLVVMQLNTFKIQQLTRFLSWRLIVKFSLAQVEDRTSLIVYVPRFFPQCSPYYSSHFQKSIQLYIYFFFQKL